MREKLLIAGAAAALLAFPVSAQVVGTASNTAGQTTSATPPVNPAPTTPPVNPAPTTPPDASAQSTGQSSAGAAASTGMAANTSATEADLRTGAVVRDSAGVEIGRISKITKGRTAGAETQVTISSGGKTVALPASSLSMTEGALVVSRTKDDIWAPK